MPGEWIECVPNFSCGRNEEWMKEIMAPFRTDPEVRLLDYSLDGDHNRSVVTLIGSYDGLKRSVVEAVGLAKDRIDLTRQRGEHPRMGATDVIPFIPIQGADMDRCVRLAREVAEEISDRYAIPTFLYEYAASAPHRKNLAQVRKGEFEGMEEKMQSADWKPDFGPDHPHPTAGATAVGARHPLIAYNVNLGTDRLDIARAIARKVRHIGGGLHYVKAMGVRLKDRGIVQVSMNLTNYPKSSLYQAFEMVKMEARRYGVSVLGSELIGLAPLQALADVAAYYLGMEDFSGRQVIESHLLDVEEAGDED